MTPGGAAQEITQLNIESLWSGGPFQDPRTSAMATAMQQYRDAIFASPTGDIDNIETLATDPGAYGSYTGAGYLVSTLNVTGAAIARVTWTQAGSAFTRYKLSFLFYRTPTHVSPTAHLLLLLRARSRPPHTKHNCLDAHTLRIRGNAGTPGMLYEILGRVRVPVAPSLAWISWVGGTEFSQDAGDAAHGFSFKGPDPHAANLALLSGSVSTASYSALRSAHFADFKSALGAFSLDLGQSAEVGKAVETRALIESYQIDTGNPYLEWVMFNYGRYLLGSSARGALPANLQGKWALDIANPWSGDSNINIQMNYWSAEMSNLDVMSPLFTYFEKNWAPRGAQTAQVLYNISRGWVTHNEMNIFGHTGMKAFDNSAEWANYPESAVWMMLHVWDHFDYTNDVAWWKAQGWPLISFHLDKLIPDLRFNDGTLVVSPCNSPEQPPITLGCAHAQQLIWQLFNAVEKGFAASGDKDTAFLAEVRTKRDAMDKGLRIGSWGQLQGRIMLVNGTRTTYSKSQVMDATTTSLIHRGTEQKMWRAASWAQLKNATEFYHELTDIVVWHLRKFGANLFSLYDPFDAVPIIQIDANLDSQNALLQAPDVPTMSTPLVITLLPALPSQWSTGSMKGARTRGGITVNLAWKAGKPTSASFHVDASIVPRPVQVVFGNKVVASFTTSSGLSKTVTSF
ncbi:glycoside hydrolase family 95 protein [Mycena leptocephala]|nr:glycoside hydrolase family 95 protein [Mycena leptocephala]